MAKPFIKWAGGKRSLLPILTKDLPEFRNYHEPMLGGGALFFGLQEKGMFDLKVFIEHSYQRKVFLSDSNQQLMSLYREVRDRPEQLLKAMRRHRLRYTEDPKGYYASIRARYNQNPSPSQFLFLNRTCFNGLYRVNSAGRFNVPWGKYKHPLLVNYAGIRDSGAVLQGVELDSESDELDWVNGWVSRVKKADLVYIDPPYFGTFRNYTPKSEADEVFHSELRTVCDILRNRGAFVMVSNSGHKYIRKLYKGWNIQKVKGSRKISCDGNRDDANDLLIRNW